MEIKENEKIIVKDSFILLCNKCFEKGEYMIPIFYLNDSKKVAYKCSKNHIINENDICKKKLTKQMIKSLNECTKEKHKEYHQEISNNFCAWCDKCCKNLCQVDLGEDLKRNHNYLLFMEIIPNFQKENEEQKIKKLKDLLDQYIRLCPDEEENINYLKKTYERNLMNFDLYYEKKIINYQTINNILFNLNGDFDENSFEFYRNNLLKNSYKFLYKAFKNNKTSNEIKKNEINIDLKFNEGIAIFNNNNKIYIALQDGSRSQLKIFDDKGNTLNAISNLLFDSAYLMVYNNNTLVAYNHNKIFIIFFSEDYKSHNILTLNLNYNLNSDIFSENLFYSKYKQKMIKTSLNYYFFLTKEKAYLLDIEKYFYEKISQTINIDIKLISSNNDNIIIANSAFYKNNNNILEGIIYIYQTKNDRKNIYKINMLNEKLENISEIKFKYLSKHKYGRGKAFNIIYNYSNDMILVFINYEIYQINFKTKEVVTIYDYSSYFFKESLDNYFIESIFFHNYNEENQKLEEIILIKYKNSNAICKFIWNEKCVSIGKISNLLNIGKIIHLYDNSFVLDSNEKNKKADKKNSKDILVIVSDNLIILS